MSVFSLMMNKEHEKIAILMQALSFYAQESNYTFTEIDGHPGVWDGREVVKDGGAKARKAFEEINDLPLW